MNERPNRLWIITIILGWFFDFLFWKKTPGINFAIFAVLCLLGGLYLLNSNGLRPNQKSLLLIPFFLAFAGITFTRAEPMTTFLAYTCTLFVMSIMSLTYLGGKWMKYGLTDYVTGYLHLIGSLIARPLTFSSEARKIQTESRISPSRNAVWPILRGLIIALPIVAIFASLLASADVVFNQRLEDFIELFNLENLPELIFRLIYILVIAYSLAGVILHAALKSNDEKLSADEKPILPPFLGFIESAIVMGSVLILFGAFVVVQFQYFFGGQTNIHVAGYTYSEYARRGFGELVTVAIFSLLMLLGLSAITQRDTERQRKLYSGLGVALVALVLVMLVSAYQRLALYEAAYGFSRMRTYTHVFLVWIGLLLIATIALELLRRERLFALTAILASFGFALSLPLLNVDAFIVQQNIARELHGDKNRMVVELDTRYFLGLSDDAVPALVDVFRSSSTPVDVKDKLGVALACIRHNRAQELREPQWQSFHFARLGADSALAGLESELDTYNIKDTELGTGAIMVEGEEFNCSAYYYD